MLPLALAFGPPLEHTSGGPNGFMTARMAPCFTGAGEQTITTTRRKNKVGLKKNKVGLCLYKVRPCFFTAPIPEKRAVARASRQLNHLQIAQHGAIHLKAHQRTARLPALNAGRTGIDVEQAQTGVVHHPQNV